MTTILMDGLRKPRKRRSTWPAGIQAAEDWANGGTWRSLYQAGSGSPNKMFWDADLEMSGYLQGDQLLISGGFSGGGITISRNGSPKIFSGNQDDPSNNDPGGDRGSIFINDQTDDWGLWYKYGSDSRKWRRLDDKPYIKTADQMVTSSTALVAITDFGVTIPSGTPKYFMDMHLWYEGHVSGDLKVGFSSGSGSTLLDWGGHVLATGDSASVLAKAIGSTATYEAQGAGVKCFVHIWGFLTGVAGTSAIFEPKFAQSASHATATKILAGSTMALYRL